VNSPRIGPLPVEDWDQESLELLNRMNFAADQPPPNILATMARHTKLLKRWLVLTNHFMMKCRLPDRDRELLILRTGYRCRAPYEWGQHAILARSAGLTEAEIRRVIDGPQAEGWAEFDAALLTAVDELHDSSSITDSTWSVLAGRYDDQQLLEVPLLVGQYHGVSYALNSWRTPLDIGVEGFPS
jgi:4-carboxymuconolactone decarboxylase